MTFIKLMHYTLKNNKQTIFRELILRLMKRHKNYDVKKDSSEALILSNTVVTTDHLTPELKLRLITPECTLWHCNATESKFSSDPFWGIYWPGGQALARYVLDNPELFCKKNILDVGSGCGAGALAAAKCGANIVLANDIDHFSIKAIRINAKLNQLKLETYSSNLIGEDIDELNLLNNEIFPKPNWDIILIGDMFYDVEFSTKMFLWLCKLIQKGKKVFIGDPGRYALRNLDEMKNYGSLVRIAEYDLTNAEHNGFLKSGVYVIQNFES